MANSTEAFSCRGHMTSQPRCRRTQNRRWKKSIIKYTLIMTGIVVEIYEFQLCGINWIGSGYWEYDLDKIQRVMNIF